jgi:hypothetical protein
MPMPVHLRQREEFIDWVAIEQDMIYCGGDFMGYDLRQRRPISAKGRDLSIGWRWSKI